ncbi:MAG: PhnD/SsuA/transferrin family substrate-binding protein [Anaerolineae bacterium]|nr:PhnD/SsuA/transferrin family substrate-binding protein [Anaerolineae bacterium]
MPTAIPTVAPTPRSTALPQSEVAAVGSEERPLQIAIVANETTDSEAIAAVEAAVLERGGLAVEFTPLASQAEALSALCASPSGEVVAAWLDGLGYAAAQAHACGDAGLVVESDADDGLSAMETINIIVGVSSDIESVSDLSGQTFCRISATDAHTWLLPSIILQANGVNPINDLGDVEDYDDIESLVNAVASGRCDGAGIDATALADAGDAADEVTVIDSVAVVRSVLIYPQEVNLTTRARLNDALLATATDEASAESLRLLIDQDNLRAAAANDFTALDSLLRRANIDLEQLGSP